MNLRCLLSLSLLGLSAAQPKEYVFRLDDVQDWWLRDIQMAIIQFAADNDMAISLGVIGGFFGADSGMVAAVQNCLNLGSSSCEVFNHGPDASSFVDGMDVSQAEDYISTSHIQIGNTLNGYTPGTFVPHQNRWNEDTVTALENLGYKVLSTSLDNGLAFDMSGVVKRMPQQTETAPFAGGAWPPVDPATILSECEERRTINGDVACVIMSHHQEFADVATAITRLTAIKAALDADGWVSKTFLDVAVGPATPNPTPPPGSPTLSPTPLPTSPPSSPPTPSPTLPAGSCAAAPNNQGVTDDLCSNCATTDANGNLVQPWWPCVSSTVLCVCGPSTPEPTPPPTTPQTPPPTLLPTPIPTSLPTASPTLPPTQPPGSSTQPPTVSPTPIPTQPPTASPMAPSGIPNWDANTVYVGGDEVVFDGEIIRAKWWTQGDTPDRTVLWGHPWEFTGTLVVRRHLRLGNAFRASE